MGRGDDRRRNQQRARERAEKGLARNDLELALDGLLALPAPARVDLLRPAAALFRSSSLALLQTGAWARLHNLAARAEAEPGLLDEDEGGAAPCRDELRWAFMLASLHTKDWGRAARYLAPLRSLLDQRAPALGRALATWIETRGELATEALQAAGISALPEPPPLDPRLGYDPPAPRHRAPLPAAPAAASDAERQVLALAGTQPFVAFAETVLEWQRRAQPEVSSALAQAAAPLAVRELLMGLDRGGRPLEASLLLARLGQIGTPTQALADEVRLGVRLALPAFLEGPIDRRSETTLRALGRAAARFADARAFVLDWLLAPEPRDQHLAVGFLLVEGMLGEPAALGAEDLLRLWGISVVRVAASTPAGADPGRAAPWLLAATEAVLADPALLGRSLRGLPIGTMGPLLAAAVDVLSVEGATGVLAAAWDIADETLRKEIAPLVAELIDRAQVGALDRDPRDLGDAALLGRLLRAMERDETPPLLPPAQVVWRRLGEAALRYDPELLSIAVSEASDEGAARVRTEEYLAGRTDIEARLEVLQAIGATERRDVGRLLFSLEQGVLRDFGQDPVSLGRALSWCFDRGAPARFLTALAGALLDAAARHPPPKPVAAPLAKAIKLASRLVKPRAGGKKTQKPRKQKSKARSKDEDRPRPQAAGSGRPRAPTSAGPAEQLGFSFDRRSQ